MFRECEITCVHQWSGQGMVGDQDVLCVLCTGVSRLCDKMYTNEAEDVAQDQPFHYTFLHLHSRVSIQHDAMTLPPYMRQILSPEKVAAADRGARLEDNISIQSCLGQRASERQTTEIGLIELIAVRASRRHPER